MATHVPSGKQKPSPEQERREQELVRKLPDEVEPAQERGERIVSGKSIATGGKSGKIVSPVHPPKKGKRPTR